LCPAQIWRQHVGSEPNRRAVADHTSVPRTQSTRTGTAPIPACTCRSGIYSLHRHSPRRDWPKKNGKLRLNRLGQHPTASLPVRISVKGFSMTALGLFSLAMASAPSIKLLSLVTYQATPLYFIPPNIHPPPIVQKS
jgi:hypothetical protein